MSLSYSVLSCKMGLEAVPPPSWGTRRKTGCEGTPSQCLGCGVGDREMSDPSSSPLTLPAIRPEGKNSRLFVFSISMASVAHWSLDVAADSQEELQDWVKKIREVAQTADARVRPCWSPGGQWASGEQADSDVACSGCTEFETPEGPPSASAEWAAGYTRVGRRSPGL